MQETDKTKLNSSQKKLTRGVFSAFSKTRSPVKTKALEDVAFWPYCELTVARLFQFTVSLSFLLLLMSCHITKKAYAELAPQLN